MPQNSVSTEKANRYTGLEKAQVFQFLLLCHLHEKLHEYLQFWLQYQPYHLLKFYSCPVVCQVATDPGVLPFLKHTRLLFLLFLQI